MIRYNEIYDHLAEELKDDPGLYESIGLIIGPFVLYSGNWGAAHHNYVDIDDGLLNPGCREADSLRPATLGNEG